MTLPAAERDGPGHEPVADEEAAEAYSRELDRAVEIGERLREAPCVPAHWLQLIREREGRDCPRVVLQPQNYRAGELVTALLKEETRPAFAALFDALMGHTAAEERTSVLRRVLATVNSKAVQQKLHPPPPPKPSRRRS